MGNRKLCLGFNVERRVLATVCYPNGLDRISRSQNVLFKWIIRGTLEFNGLI